MINAPIYGLLAEFSGPDELVHAAQRSCSRAWLPAAWKATRPSPSRASTEALSHFKPLTAVAVIFLISARAGRGRAATSCSGTPR